MSFATADDVVPRLGRALTTTEQGLLDLATSVIADAVDKDDAWAAALSPVPVALKLLCIELVFRGVTNPTGATSLHEGLGAYQHAERYSIKEEQGAFALTDAETLRARRAVYGSNARSARADDLANHVGFDTWPQTWGDIYLDENVIES
ncbi:MAG: hypothetical protein ACXVHX_26705 [Solirubrobacteraceae bacterium]